ncbi:SDR family oxidoreductase [Saccharibacillus sp. CPCC 101409]|uniref:SDR family NAD(P)-dependent oxidoreductase n=1 Tax=Saccharibacillus sp. CPCC 101409 TaxID=3058041 RepID=UPI002672B686|nr:SDR family oxidoreductase [Saccharibacillus sp. CPCC 101409]MDO3412766.1 SDR family oxidoreductase [Saccharibacillus sp. CPCC 101409]
MSDTQSSEQFLVALVTGGAKGVGLGISHVLAQKGYRIALTYHSSSDDMKTMTRELKHIYGAEPFAIQSDLKQPGEPQKVVDAVLEHFGRIDLVVNNAGEGMYSELTELDEEDLNGMVALDYTAPILVSKYAVRSMIEREIKGSVHFITSSRGERAYPGDSIYGGMKAALIRSCGSLALEWAPHGIRTNCVAPGATVNNLDQNAHEEPLGRKIPLGRLGTPSDIGEAIAWLASDKASYITGINLRIDGGLILPGMPEDTSKEAGYGWGFMYPERK